MLAALAVSIGLLARLQDASAKWTRQSFRIEGELEAEVQLRMREVVEGRLEVLGARGGWVGLDSEARRVTVMLPPLPVEERERVRALLVQRGGLELRAVVEDDDWKDAGLTQEEARRQVLEQPGGEEAGRRFPDSGETRVLWAPAYRSRAQPKIPRKGAFVRADDPDAVTGEDIDQVRVSQDPRGLPVPVFSVKPTARERLERFTKRIKGRRMAMLLDGRVVSAPRVEATLSYSGLIFGIDDLAEIREIAGVLSAGMLPRSLVFEKEEPMSAPNAAPAETATPSSSQERIWELEVRLFWTFHQEDRLEPVLEHVAREFVCVLDQAELRGFERWRRSSRSASWDGTMSDIRFLPLGGEAALVTYLATGLQRIRGTSAWALRDGKWVVVFHQETTFR
jgi:hypothetical protein